MCYGCWTELGKPKMKSFQIEEAARLVAHLYKMQAGAVGGNLHIVTDDWNLEDDHIQWCLDRVNRIKQGDVQEYDDTDPTQIDIEGQILTLMQPMSEEERGAALALWEGFEE